MLAQATCEGFNYIFNAVDALSDACGFFMKSCKLEGWSEAGCEALLINLRRQRAAVLEQAQQLLPEAAHAKARLFDLVEV